MSAAILLERGRLLDGEYEVVAVGVGREGVDESFVQVARASHLVTEPEVDVLGQSSVVVQADLKRHSSLEHPLPGLRRLETRDDALEQDAPAEAVETDSRLGRPGEKPMLESGAQGLRRLVRHGASGRWMARSMCSAALASTASARDRRFRRVSSPFCRASSITRAS